MIKKKRTSISRDNDSILCEKTIEIFINDFSCQYNTFIKSLYEQSYIENPEAFIGSSPNNIDAYIIKVDKSIFGNEFITVFYQGSGIIKYLDKVEDKYYTQYKNYSSNTDFFTFIISDKIDDLGKFYFQETLLIDQVINSIENRKNNFEDAYNEIKKIFWELNYKDKILNQLKNDGKNFVEHINQDSSYYAKDAYKFSYSELNFEDIIKIVNNRDFEYALNESLAAYGNSLYLAATVTAGVALENLLVVILEKEKISIETNDSTELGALSNKLLKNGVIDKREKNRIMLAAKYRNLASHANKGRVIRNDAKTIYTEIFNLASSYFGI